MKMKSNAVLLKLSFVIALLSSLAGCSSLGLIDTLSGLDINDMSETTVSAMTAQQPSDTPSPTSTGTPTATVTTTPTMTPTPIGGSTKPILAISMEDLDGNQSYIHLIELFTERMLGRIPVSQSGQALRLSPDAGSLAYVDIRDGQQGIYLFDLITEEITLLYAQPEETGITKLRWSKDQQWIAFEMDIFARRNTELWVLNVETVTAQYLSVGYTVDWLPSGALYYQNSVGTNYKYDITTGKTSLINYTRLSFPAMESLTNTDLSNISTYYFPSLEMPIFEGRNHNDPNNPLDVVIRHEVDETAGLYVAHYETPTDLYMWDLLLSPDGKRWLICFNEGESIRGFSSTGFAGGEFFTAITSKDELPITRQNTTFDNFQPYLWAPDGNSILGFEHAAHTISGVKIYNLESGQVLYDYAFLTLDNLRPVITLSDQKPKTFDIKWNNDQVDVSSLEFVTPKPTTTATLPVTVVEEQPLIDHIIGYQMEEEIEFNLDSDWWDFNKAILQDDGSIKVRGTGDWDGKLDYKYYLHNNQGVLVKFMFDEKSEGVLALIHGRWNTPGYRQWGTIFYEHDSRPLVSDGSDHSSEPQIISEFEMRNGVWYNIFLGIYDNKLVQVLWDPNYPVEYNLSYYDYGDTESTYYYFHLSVNQGRFYISDMSLYEFQELAE